VASGQAVALLLLGPVLGKVGVQVYNWIAVLAIVASAGWLLATLLMESTPARREHRQ
jgi:hypothetical protein